MITNLDQKFKSKQSFNIRDILNPEFIISSDDSEISESQLYSEYYAYRPYPFVINYENLNIVTIRANQFLASKSLDSPFIVETYRKTSISSLECFDTAQNTNQLDFDLNNFYISSESGNLGLHDTSIDIISNDGAVTEANEHVNSKFLFKAPTVANKQLTIETKRKLKENAWKKKVLVSETDSSPLLLRKISFRQERARKRNNNPQMCEAHEQQDDLFFMGIIILAYIAFVLIVDFLVYV